MELESDGRFHSADGGGCGVSMRRVEAYFSGMARSTWFELERLEQAVKRHRRVTPEAGRQTSEKAVFRNILHGTVSPSKTAVSSVLDKARTSERALRFPFVMTFL